MTLYKYVVAERLDVLQNSLIRFSQPSVLNDPWDMRPHVERLFTDDDMEERVLAPLKPQSDKDFLDYISQLFMNLAVASDVPVTSFEELQETVRKAYEATPDELRQLFDDAFAESMANLKDVVPHVVDLIPNAINNTVGILSLTTRPDHPLMWSHYTNNHTGFVLGFDETDPFFRSPRYGKSDDIGSPRRIKYCVDRPRFDPLIDLSTIESITDEAAMRWMDKMFFTKSEAWSYEEEWRMIKGLNEATRVIENPDGDIYLFSIPPSCLKSVVLGERMPAEKRKTLVEFLMTDARYSHVKLFEAKSSTSNFAITITPLNTD
jgi:hypothetical protein